MFRSPVGLSLDRKGLDALRVLRLSAILPRRENMPYFESPPTLFRPSRMAALFAIVKTAGICPVIAVSAHVVSPCLRALPT